MDLAPALGYAVTELVGQPVSNMFSRSGPGAGFRAIFALCAKAPGTIAGLGSPEGSQDGAMSGRARTPSCTLGSQRADISVLSEDSPSARRRRRPVRRSGKPSEEAQDSVTSEVGATFPRAR